MEISVLDFRPAGYAYLLEKFTLAGMPNWHSSSVSTAGTHYSKTQDGYVRNISTPLALAPGLPSESARNGCVCKVWWRQRAVR